MNVVLSNVEESIHHVDISDDGTPSAPRVSPCPQLTSWADS